MGKKCTTKKYFSESKNQRDISLELDKILKKIKIDYNAGLNIDRIILSNKTFFINNLGQEYWNTISDILKTYDPTFAANNAYLKSYTSYTKNINANIKQAMLGLESIKNICIELMGLFQTGGKIAQAFGNPEFFKEKQYQLIISIKNYIDMKSIDGNSVYGNAVQPIKSSQGLIIRLDGSVPITGNSDFNDSGKIYPYNSKSYGSLQLLANTDYKIIGDTLYAFTIIDYLLDRNYQIFNTINAHNSDTSILDTTNWNIYNSGNKSSDRYWGNSLKTIEYEDPNQEIIIEFRGVKKNQTCIFINEGVPFYFSEIKQDGTSEKKTNLGLKRMGVDLTDSDYFNHLWVCTNLFDNNSIVNNKLAALDSYYPQIDTYSYFLLPKYARYNGSGTGNLQIYKYMPVLKDGRPELLTLVLTNKNGTDATGNTSTDFSYVFDNYGTTSVDGANCGPSINSNGVRLYYPWLNDINPLIGKARGSDGKEYKIFVDVAGQVLLGIKNAIYTIYENGSKLNTPSDHIITRMYLYGNKTISNSAIYEIKDELATNKLIGAQLVPSSVDTKLPLTPEFPENDSPLNNNGISDNDPYSKIYGILPQDIDPSMVTSIEEYFKLMYVNKPYIQIIDFNYPISTMPSWEFLDKNNLFGDPSIESNRKIWHGYHIFNKYNKYFKNSTNKEQYENYCKDFKDFYYYALTQIGYTYDEVNKEKCATVMYFNEFIRQPGEKYDSSTINSIEAENLPSRDPKSFDYYKTVFYLDCWKNSTTASLDSSGSSNYLISQSIKPGVNDIYNAIKPLIEISEDITDLDGFWTGTINDSTNWYQSGRSGPSPACVSDLIDFLPIWHTDPQINNGSGINFFGYCDNFTLSCVLCVSNNPNKKFDNTILEGSNGKKLSDDLSDIVIAYRASTEFSKPMYVNNLFENTNINGKNYNAMLISSANMSDIQDNNPITPTPYFWPDGADRYQFEFTFIYDSNIRIWLDLDTARVFHCNNHEFVPGTKSVSLSNAPALATISQKNLNDLIINLTDMLYENQQRARSNTRKLEFAVDEQSILKRNNEKTLEKLLSNLRETIYNLENNDDRFSLLSTTKATNLF